MSSVSTSDKRRMPKGARWPDQFGRLYDLEINVETGDWIAAPILRDCRPVVDLPQNFVNPVVENGEIQYGRVFADFRTFRKQIAVRQAQWMDELRAAAKRMYPGNYGEMLANPPVELLIEVGPRPWPMEILQAAEAGNSWALGKRQRDGSPFPRPKWVTDEMLDSVAALKKTTGYKATADDLDFDVSLYADDYFDEEEAVDPDAVGGKTIPVGSPKNKGKR